MKTLGTFILMIALGLQLAWAQPPGGQERNERIEAMKVSFITEQLDLTPEEAKVFWPIHNAYEKEKKSMMQAYRQRAGNTTQDLNELTSDEAKNLIAKEIEFQQKRVDMMKQYVGKFQSVLPVEKVAILLTLENKFKKKLVQQLKQSGGNR